MATIVMWAGAAIAESFLGFRFVALGIRSKTSPPTPLLKAEGSIILFQEKEFIERKKYVSGNRENKIKNKKVEADKIKRCANLLNPLNKLNLLSS
jgi:hypothetical protein